MAKIKLLIIGGTGVLSSAVVKEAVSHDIDVTIVNRGKRKRLLPDSVKTITVDYRDRELIISKLSGLHFDTVIDFLCYTPKQIEYSIDLLHAVADQYIFISSTCVYDTRVPGIKTEDAQKVLTEWDYSVNKWKCECILKERSEKLGFNYSIVRPCITYDDTRIPYGIMPLYGYHWTLCARILSGKPVLRWDGGTAVWNMMRVEDFAVGVLGLIGNENAYGEAYNLSGDISYSWNDVIKELADILGKSPIYFDLTSEEYKRYYPKRKGEIAGRALDSVVSNKKIKSLVEEYKTRYSLREGLEKTVAAYRENNYQLGIDWSYDAITDRIIRSVSKEKGLPINNYNLGFTDYLGTATSNDKRTYWLEYNRNNLFVRLYSFSIRCVNKIKRTIGR